MLHLQMSSRHKLDIEDGDRKRERDRRKRLVRIILAFTYRILFVVSIIHCFGKDKYVKGFCLLYLSRLEMVLKISNHVIL